MTRDWCDGMAPMEAHELERFWQCNICKGAGCDYCGHTGYYDIEDPTTNTKRFMEAANGTRN